MGCGRVGARLATSLDRMNHSVSIIDTDAQAFRRLRTDFSGRKLKGVGFDRDQLVAAGIEDADAFAAVSNGDNSNIISARVAREVFAVPTVVARIYDPRRAEVYERLGIATVATVAWTTGQFLRRINPGGVAEQWRDSTGTVMLSEVTFDPLWVGRTVDEIARATGTHPAFVTRYGQSLLPERDTVLQDGDLLHLLCHPDDKTKVAEVAGNPPGKGE